MPNKEVYPKCVYVKNKFCWQRAFKSNVNTYSVREYKKPDESYCAACIAARTNYGDDALRQPLTQADIKKEREADKNGSKSI